MINIYYLQIGKINLMFKLRNIKSCSYIMQDLFEKYDFLLTIEYIQVKFSSSVMLISRKILSSYL